MNIISMTNNEFKKHCAQSQHYYTYHETAAGRLIVYSFNQGIYRADFDEAFLAKSGAIYRETLDTSTMILVGTAFQIKVWMALLAMPKGTISYYEHVACSINHPTAHRAVANAIGQNKIAYFVPCHRILRKSGELGGYRWGMDIKKQLLEDETGLE